MPALPLKDYLAIGKLLALLGLIAVVCWQSSQIHRWHTQAEHCASARHDDAVRYADAQKAAQAANHAQVQKIEQLQETINEASRSSFTADRDRLRAQSGASKGAPGATGTPQVPHAAPGTPPEVVSLPPAELLRAQELELQLNALIDWINQQSAANQSRAP